METDPRAQHPLLVTTEWLAEHLEDPGLVIIDCGEELAYKRAHIPGAGGAPHPYWKSANNRRLVMEPAEFEAAARRLGVSEGSPVVVYDDNASLHAARAWWVFDHFGHREVRVLDGGFHAWLDEGRPLNSRVPRPEPGNFTARVDDARNCMLDELKQRVEAGTAPQIWDTRSDGEWDGTNDRGNQRTGRVPGSTHLEWFRLVEGPPARRFRPLDEIRGALQDAGIDPEAPTVTYCQGGIRGAFGAFILELLGNHEARNYDGSMAEWANREDTPLTLA